MAVLDTQRGPLTAAPTLPSQLSEAHTEELSWARAVRQAMVVLAVVIAIASLGAPRIAPVITHDFPDPSVLAVGSGYYAYSTQSHYGNQVWHVPVRRADSLQGAWAAQGDAMPQLPAWVATDAAGRAGVWAPKVTPRGDGVFLLYFTAPASATTRCIGAALSRSPAGPFAPQPHPLVCQPENHDTIDPATFTDANGARYLLYTNGAHASTIWLQQLTSDGLQPSAHHVR